MYLKQLTVRGFKSFASTTSFTFEPGVTAVVGPNGSGKSNVVDALAWVMGEQGAKNLRGGKMDDVIFAGTSTRPALGRAQVALTIDNSDGALPIDYTEVTISRTLFRSGGSEYTINDRPCRLLDIQELLSDSGLGREMHVIVGQGQLDRVLHATSEDRRGLIEEAAGILKHRRRRERAYRKLQSTDANLARLADLTSEVARALKPLERQANVARRARDIQFDLKDAQSRLAADDLAAARRQQAATTARLARLTADLADLESSLERADAGAPALRSALESAQTRLDEAHRSMSAIRRTMDRLQVVGELASTRAASMAEAPVNTDADQEIRRLEAQLDEARESREAAQAQAAEALTAEQAASSEAAAAASSRSDCEAILAQRLREQAAAREELLTVRGAADAVGGRVQSARSELERAQALADDAAQAETQAHRDLADLTDGDSTEPDSAPNPGLALATAAAQRKRADERLTVARRAARDADARASALAAEAATLESTLSSMTPSRPTRGAARLFTDGLTVSADNAAALGALLAEESLRPVLSPEEIDDDAVWASPVTGTRAPFDPNAMDELPEGSVWAVRMADHAAFPDTLREMLSGAVVVPSAAVALEVLRATPSVTRAVTREGLVITRTGQSRPLAEKPNAVDLHERLDEVQSRAESARTAAEDSARAVDEAEAAVQSAREREQTLRAEQAAEATQRAVRQAAVASAKRSAEQARQRATTLTKAAEQSAARLAELLVQHDEATRRVALLEDVHSGSTDAEPLEDLRARAETARSKAESAQRIHTEAALARRSAEERLRALAARVRDLEASLERSRETAAAQERAERRRRILVARAERVAGIAAEAQAVAHDERAACQRALDEAQREFTDARRAHDDHRRTQQEGRTRHQSLTGERATAEAHLEHESLRTADLERHAVESLGLSPASLLEQFGPEVPLADGRDFDREDQTRRLKRAQSEMQALGKVNPLALEEFAALEQRHTFLASQLADLRGSRGDLLKIIKDVDDTIERVFAEAYADTAREFVQVFERLFPGGEGSLELTDPDDMLASGLEVNARPAGKKVKRLSLLSGGERSLTAIALLVAIFKARPSPFYVMDEVEAALDDANLGRLIGLFEELRESSQLIIITHQKRTMEIADTLYGVSMRGDGVSLVINQKMGRPAESQ
jgi:chromosome segregation protein